MRNNKNTIIKAINISECEFLRYSKSEKCNLCDLSQVGNNGHFFCDDYNNCYYKQLKQKEQDYETLANQYNAVVEQNKQLETQLNNHCSNCEIAKNMSKMIYLVSNGMMSYANYTYEDMKKVYLEQIEKRAKEINLRKLNIDGENND